MKGLAVALVACALTACRATAPVDDGTPWPDAVRVVAAGDIADCRYVGAANSIAAQTAALIEPADIAVLTIGDNAYPTGAAGDFAGCFDATWGAFKERMHPSPGNHEYQTPGAAGYFDYFAARAGPARRGYYSIDLAGWHIVSLNSNVDARVGSEQYRWLVDDLLKASAPCTLAVWHHPVYTSGPHGNDPRMHDPLAALHAAGADVVLVGHDHVYERMTPHDADGRPDPVRGIRSFTVGTGGARLYEFKAVHAASELRDNSTHGVLKLALAPGRYRWAFMPVGGGPARDRGQAVCHRR